MARAVQPVKVDLGRLVIVELPYRKACRGLVPHEPTTWPASVIPYATLGDPARGARPPMSTLCFPVHTAASRAPVLVSAQPATCPDRLTAFPTLLWPPRGPRSVILPFPDKNARLGWRTHLVGLGYVQGTV